MLRPGAAGGESPSLKPKQISADRETGANERTLKVEGARKRSVAPWRGPAVSIPFGSRQLVRFVYLRVSWLGANHSLSARFQVLESLQKKQVMCRSCFLIPPIENRAFLPSYLQETPLLQY